MTTIRRQVKNVIKNYSEAEVKVREATSNDPWGPSSTLMSEISDLTYNIVALGDIMRMIWKRLNDHGKNWRHVYKSLVLLDYLIKNGNEKVAQQCKEHIVAIQTLKDFQYLEENKDQGANVRDKAKNLVALLRDDERLKQERQKALKARERFAQNAMSISSDNKVTYGTSGTGQQRYQGTSSKSGGNYSDPYGGGSGTRSDSTSDPSLAPDLEAVRPSDTNEEELQVSLALMLSQQEHEEEVKRKRADEAKLQIALEQSKIENVPKENSLLDLASGGFNGAAAAASHDPWAEQLNDPWPSHSAMPNNKLSDDDAWLDGNKQQTHGKPNTNPWSTTPSITQHQQDQLKLNDPWSSSSSSTPITDLNRNQHNNLLDDFDVFTTNRIQSPPTIPVPQKTNDPFDDFFGGSTGSGGGGAAATSSLQTTNPWGSVTQPPIAAAMPQAPQQKQQQQPKPFNSSMNTNTGVRKTPESFLGENSSLVNLDNLISTTNQRPKSTNPFGGPTTAAQQQSSVMSSLSNNSILSGPQTTTQQPRPPSVNPFQAQVQKGPTINQLTYQQQQQFNGFNAQQQPPQLSQPLIMAPSPTQMIPGFQAMNLNGNTQQSTNPFLMM